MRIAANRGASDDFDKGQKSSSNQHNDPICIGG
jgi:hypothetical protein